MSILGLLSKLAGRGIVPFLKHLIGPWLMARHDLQSEVANSSKAGLAALFPDKKLEEALRLYSEQVKFFFPPPADQRALAFDSVEDLFSHLQMTYVGSDRKQVTYLCMVQLNEPSPTSPTQISLPFIYFTSP